MRTCINHAIKIEEALGDEELIAIVPEVISGELFTLVDGDKFDYNVYKLVGDVDIKAKGCPFCYIEEVVKKDGYVDEFIERLKKGEFEWKTS